MLNAILPFPGFFFSFLFPACFLGGSGTTSTHRAPQRKAFEALGRALSQIPTRGSLLRNTYLHTGFIFGLLEKRR